MRKSHAEKDSVRSVERALSLLECFSHSRRRLTLNDLMEASALPKTTVVRLIASLENKKFLEIDPSGTGYRLGKVLFRLGHVVEADMDLIAVAQPTMRECAQRTLESVEVNVVIDDSRVCITKIDSVRTLRHVIPVGKRLPLYRGGSGKLLLAHMPRTQQQRILGEHESELGVSIDEALAELDEIKRRGCVVSIGNRLAGAIAISAPIRDAAGEVVAGFAISGAAARYDDAEIQKVLAEVLAGARKISQDLGYTPE